MTSSSLIISFGIVGLVFLLYNLWKNPTKISAFETFPSFLLGCAFIVCMWPSWLYFQTKEATKND